MDKATLQEYKRIRADGYSAKDALNFARYHVRMRASPFFRAFGNLPDTVEFLGAEFTARVEYDDTGESPWTHCEPIAGFESVEQYRRAPEHLPSGWIWLAKPERHNYGYAYNRAAALRTAKDWPMGAHSVAEEIRRFESWLADQWHYVGIVVELDGKSESLWGIESDCGEYLAEVAEDMARRLLADRYADKQRADVARCFC